MSFIIFHNFCFSFAAKASGRPCQVWTVCGFITACSCTSLLLLPINTSWLNYYLFCQLVLAHALKQSWYLLWNSLQDVKSISFLPTLIHCSIRLKQIICCTKWVFMAHIFSVKTAHKHVFKHEMFNMKMKWVIHKYYILFILKHLKYSNVSTIQFLHMERSISNSFYRALLMH